MIGGQRNPLAKKMETELNNHSKDGWTLDSFELGHYGYSAIITLKNETFLLIIFFRQDIPKFKLQLAYWIK